MYDIETGRLVHTYNAIHDDFINVLKFSNQDPNLFATSSFDKTIKMWDIREKSTVSLIWSYITYF
jgi:WD40 repeat protein